MANNKTLDQDIQSRIQSFLAELSGLVRRSALEVWPSYLPALQGLASLTLRVGDREDPRLEGWLQEIGLRGETNWSSWAQARMGHKR